MIVNRDQLREAAPIWDMLPNKVNKNGVSYGLSEAGYDIRLAQTVEFTRSNTKKRVMVDGVITAGNFTLASTIEQFKMPDNLVGIVHDKSTWARLGLSVFNTVIEPGWEGYLTLELVYHGEEGLIIPAGSGIAQVVFHQTTSSANYNGKYQNQENKPVAAKLV